MTSGKRISITQIILLLASISWLLVAGTPFYLMALTGFKARFELMSGGSVFDLPEVFLFDNYREVLFEGPFLKYLGNSVFVVSISVLLILTLSAMSSYVFARIKFRGRSVIFSLIIAGLVIPLHVTLIPVYLLTQQIGIYDTLWALIGPYVAFNLPLSIFILTEFMRQIPIELEEAARIDGSSTLNTFIKIILPLSTPGMATLAIYNAVMLWNEFVFSFVLILNPDSRTLPLAIWEYQGEYSMNIPAVMAVLTLSALPLILLFIVGQERVIKGMMAGALK
ncbi:carbohydrate ABC transporter permease [Phototrophicus methaneseepsis]|uniref:Carbohydrate ABC transporter permease n=1 Tax=Phototrophicus methaneseepsis TaxID=2710758 RepID=A0A7S8ECR1_9CHLR|nr:carbohydrate ABC transporter permease [Phototrophicus methaneseepsis]QPC84575.1 carbohydrate ABC transporter permease [Phototrophicus methaneseepsis]